MSEEQQQQPQQEQQISIDEEIHTQVEVGQVSPGTARAIKDMIKSEEAKLNETNSDDSDSSASLSSSVSSGSSQSLNTTPASSSTAVVPQPQQQIQPAANNNDDFENLQKAVQILGKAKTLDELKKYDESLKLYRQGVDMLLEELIVRQGTDQSRSYLRQKCNDFMNRIDQLKLIIQIENQSKENKENQA